MPESVVRRSLLVVMVGWLGGASVAPAASFDPAPGADSAVGNTLRAAIVAANASPEDDLITLIAGTYEISLPNGGVQENLGATGDLDVLQGTVTIAGAGAGTSVVRVVNGVDRAFHVAGATLVLEGLSVEDGLARDDGTAVAPGTTVAQGGGILCSPCTLELDAVELAGNVAAGGDGPSPNGSAGGAGQHALGGGVAAIGGTVRLAGGTLFSANDAVGGGGGDGAAARPGAAKAGGPAGDGSGGGLYLDLVSTLAATGPIHFAGNRAIGGSGGTGGSGDDTTGGAGGSAGDGRGGALFSPQAPLPAGTGFDGNLAIGGAGGTGGESFTDPGGVGGAGGLASGGAVWLAGPTPAILSEVTFATNQALGGAGGAGGPTFGSALAGAEDGGNGGAGGGAEGGALAVDADLLLDRILIEGQLARGGGGGHGGASGLHSGGAGGAGGGCLGGAVTVIGGSVELRVTRAVDGTCAAGDGGNGGAGTAVAAGLARGGIGGAARGGAIGTHDAPARVLVVDSEVADNEAVGGDGGSGGPCQGTCSGADGGAGGVALGGGISTQTGELELRNSTLSANRAAGGLGGDGGAGPTGGAGGKGGDAQGGNAFTFAAGIVLDNSTLAGGAAVAAAGGTAGEVGGAPGSPGDPGTGGNLGIAAGVPNAGTLTSTLLADGTGSADPDLDGLVSACRSLVETVGPSGGLDLTCDVTYGNTVDPQLLPLAFNGGTTRTHAFPATSFVLDRGTNPLALPFDQRGAPFPRVVGGEADIGAFELAANLLAAVSVTVAPPSVPEAGPGDLVYTFLRTDSQGAPLGLALTICYTMGGTASPASDYTGFTTGGACLANGTVTFAAGSATATVTITPTPDAVPEVAESVLFTVVAGAGYAPTAPNAATGAIVEPTALAAIPTLGEWGLLALVLLLGGLAVRRLAGA